MLNPFARRLTAGALGLVLGAGTALQAQTPTVAITDRSSDSETSAIVITRRDPEPRPRPLGEWKLDDISRARWIEEDPRSRPPTQQQAKKKPSHRGLAVMLIAIGGAVAGGYFGSVVQGSLCECDDRRAIGAAYGGLFGGAIAGIVAYGVMR